MSKPPNDKLSAFRKIQKVVADGFSGILPNGNIVDRREHPDAIPIPENGLLGVPKPKG